MSIEYTHDEEGGYRLFDDGQECQLSDQPVMQLAIAYAAPRSPDMMWTLHKHGPESSVRAWFDHAAQAFGKAGPLGQEMRDELYLLTGTIDVDDLNRAIATSGYVKKLVSNHQIRAEAIDVPSRDVPDAPAIARPRM